VQVSAPGYDGQVLVRGRVAQESVLLRRGVMDLMVLDASTLKPCADASLLIGETAIELANGAASLPRPLPGTREVRAACAGYWPYRASRTIGADTAILEVRLEPCRVEGEVVAQDTGKPLAGARAVLLGHERTTAAGGMFVFAGLPGMEALADPAARQALRLTVTCPGYRPFACPLADPTTGEKAPLPDPAAGILLRVEMEKASASGTR